MNFNLDDVIKSFKACFPIRRGSFDFVPKEIEEIPEVIKFRNKYEHINPEMMNYYEMNLFLLESKHLTDDAFLFFLPHCIQTIIDNEGHIRFLVDRLKKINIAKMNDKQIDVIKELIDALRKIDQVVHGGGKKSKPIVF